MKKMLHPHTRLISFSQFIMRNTIGRLVKFIWVKRVVHTHSHKLPKGSYILAANHQSFFDFLSMTSVSKRNIHFLAAEKFFKHPLWKILMVLTGQIKVDRTSEDKSTALETANRIIRQGKILAIFPEGTRSPSKTEMLKGFTGVAKFALEHNIPIIPVGIKGADDVMPKGGKVSFVKTIELHYGKPLHYPDLHGKHADKISCEKVTQEVMLEISKLSGKHYLHSHE